jgi:hypothetical protein
MRTARKIQHWQAHHPQELNRGEVRCEGRTDQEMSPSQRQCKNLLAIMMLLSSSPFGLRLRSPSIESVSLQTIQHHCPGNLSIFVEFASQPPCHCLVGLITLLNRRRGLKHQLSNLTQINASFSDILFLVLVVTCAQQLLRSTCQFLLERSAVVILFVELCEYIKSFVPILLGELLPTSANLTRTLGASADTGGFCVAAGEIQGREDSMACDIVVHSGGHSVIVVDGQFSGDRLLKCGGTYNRSG